MLISKLSGISEHPFNVVVEPGRVGLAKPLKLVHDLVRDHRIR